MVSLSREHIDTQTDTEPTIYCSQQCDTRSTQRSSKIKGVVTVPNATNGQQGVLQLCAKKYRERVPKRIIAYTNPKHSPLSLSSIGPLAPRGAVGARHDGLSHQLSPHNPNPTNISFRRKSTERPIRDFTVCIICCVYCTVLILGR